MKNVVLTVLGGSMLLGGSVLMEVRGDEAVSADVRLTVELVDGSRVIGRPSIGSVSVHTAYTKMDIDLPFIKRIDIEENHENASLALRNGDRFNGVINLGPLALETVFGGVTIGVEHIVTLHVQSGDLQSGLLLHYDFDDDDGMTVVDRSGHNRHGRRHGAVRRGDGVSGSAIGTSSKDTYVRLDGDQLPLEDLRALTVSAWVKIDAFATYGRMVGVGGEGIPGSFNLSVGGVYGGKPYEGGFGLRLANDETARVRVPRSVPLKEWCHVAGVYDGRRVFYYVNAVEIGSAEVPEGSEDAAIAMSPGADLIVGRGAGRPTWYDTHINGAIDDVRLYRRALSAQEVAALHTAFRR